MAGSYDLLTPEDNGVWDYIHRGENPIDASGFDSLTDEQRRQYDYEINNCRPNFMLRKRSWCEGCAMFIDRICPKKFKPCHL